MDKKYPVGEKTYIQRPLVLGQVEQLIEHLKGLKFPKTFDLVGIQESLGEKIYLALAIILVEEGKSPKRTLDELETIADEIHWTIRPETVLGVVEDFFELTPLASILQKLSGVMLNITSRLSTGSERPLSSSPRETSPRETISSGDIPPENASLSSNT